MRRIFIGSLLIAGLCSGLGPGLVHAEHYEPQPLPRRTVGISFIGFGAGSGKAAHAGMGLNFEAGISHRRWLLLAEVAPLWGLQDAHDGPGARVGVAARYIARSVEIDHGGAIELIGEASLGLEAFAWRQSGHLLTPDLLIGGGTQVRFLKDGQHLAIRFGGRLLFAPPVDEPTTAACRGTCSTSKHHIVQGVMAVVGASW